MPAQRFRYIGETPAVFVPDMKWGDPNDEALAVHPGDVSEPYEGEIHSEVIVPVGSDAEKAWVAAHTKPEPAKGGKN